MSKTEELQRLREEHVPKGPFNVTPYFAADAKGVVITDEQLDRGLDILEESLGEI